MWGGVTLGEDSSGQKQESHVLTHWVLRHLEARRGLPCLAPQKLPTPKM